MYITVGKTTSPTGDPLPERKKSKVILDTDNAERCYCTFQNHLEERMAFADFQINYQIAFLPQRFFATLRPAHDAPQSL